MTAGSNCVPALRRSSSIASAIGRPRRYARSVVIALNASQAATMRAIDGDLVALQALGIAVAVPSLVVVADDVADLGEEPADAVQHVGAVAGWRRTTSHSSGVSGPGLLMISFGTLILPTSCSSAANSVSWRARSPSPS